jgi:hypothetical protein
VRGADRERRHRQPRAPDQRRRIVRDWSRPETSILDMASGDCPAPHSAQHVVKP